VKTFEYRGFDFDGRARKGLVEAPDTKAAREKLAKGGVLANKVSPAGQRTVGGGSSRGDGLNVELRGTVYRELGALLRAGLPMVKALDILIDSPEMAACQASLAGVRDAIREGASLAEALTKASDRVTAFERSLIAVGERSGTLGEVIERLASFLEEQQALKDRVKTALIYPAIVLVLALVVAIGVFVFVLPRTATFLDEMNIPMPLITRLMVGAGRFVTIWGLPIGIVAVLGILYLRKRAAADDAIRRRLDRKLFSLPLIGTGYTVLVNLRFSRTLAVLLRGGVSLVEGLSLAGNASGSAWVAHLASEAAESVRHGSGLAEAVRNIPPLSATLPGWIQAGEASGDLENLLLNASDRYQSRWDRFVVRSLGLIEPVIVVLLGVFVLFVALAILAPIIAANDVLQ
jgi:general secretion pathway protein F